MVSVVSVIYVDEGEVVCTLSQNMSIGQVFDTISTRTDIPAHMIILFDINGVLINENLTFSKQVSENSQLFLFRKDGINLECTAEKKDFTQFSRYPSDFYHEPFPFQDYEDFPPGYEKIPIIENTLFQLSQTARELYAKYMVSTEFLSRTKQILECRLIASDVLLKNLRIFYKEVKLHWKALLNQALDLQKSVTLVSSDFNSFISKSYGPTIDSIFQEGRFKRFGKELQIRVNNFTTKIDELKKSVFESVKDKLRSSQESVENVRYTTQTFLESYENNEAITREPSFIEGFFACRYYTDFRDTLERVVDPNQHPKKEYANRLLAMEADIPFYKESQLQLQKFLNDINPIEKEMNINVKRVGRLYGTNIVRMVVEAAHQLKYRVKDKLQKFQDKYNSLAQQKEFLYIPLKLEEACNSAQEEVTRSNENSANTKIVYIQLCEILTHSQLEREKFLSKYGTILPKAAFPDLIKPLIKRSHLRHLLKITIDDDLKNKFETNKEGLTPEELTQCYEAELLKMERIYNSRLDEVRQREERLEKDMVYLSHSLVKSAREKEYLEKLIRDYSQELDPIRKKDGSSEKYVKSFQEEVRKLREKEAAFKRMHMENLKALKEENKKLKQELEERRR